MISIHPITKFLQDGLEATTSYSKEDKPDLNRKPNHDGVPKWKRFYQFGSMLCADTSLLDADGNPTGFKLEVKAVYRDHEAKPGDIITSGNGKSYMVQTNGSIRKIK